jgi:hypothetical protein
MIALALTLAALLLAGCASAPWDDDGRVARVTKAVTSDE